MRSSSSKTRKKHDFDLIIKVDYTFFEGTGKKNREKKKPPKKTTQNCLGKKTQENKNPFFIHL